jgi:hypothetical protein
MSGNKLNFSSRLITQPDHANAPVRVRHSEYVKFSRWLDAELGKLVARWQHTAAPAAMQGPRGRARPH